MFQLPENVIRHDETGNYAPAQAITSKHLGNLNHEEEFCSSVSTEAKFEPSMTGIKSLADLVQGI